MIEAKDGRLLLERNLTGEPRGKRPVCRENQHYRLTERHEKRTKAQAPRLASYKLEHFLRDKGNTKNVNDSMSTYRK